MPITRHPLFPAIVALWFAALIGMGSFALSTSLLETLVLEGHVDSLIPAAAPPLGTTARLLLALGLGAAGGALGWFLALRMGGAKTEAAPQVFKFADLDDIEGLEAAAPWPGVSQKPLSREELTEFTAPAVDPRSLPVTTEEPRGERALAPAPEQPSDAAPFAAPTAAQRIASADLDTLSHVELVERLAIALQRRQAALGTPSADPARADDPVVRFPGVADRQSTRLTLLPPASRPAPEATEKALREALATLQRMSGGG